MSRNNSTLPDKITFGSVRRRLAMQPIFSLKITQLCAAFLFIVQFSRFESYRPTDELDRIRIANLTKLLFPKGKHSLRISAKEDDLPCLHFNHVITDNEALEKRRLPSLFHTAALNTIKKFLLMLIMSSLNDEPKTLRTRGILRVKVGKAQNWLRV